MNDAETRIRKLEFQIRRGNLETELMLKPFLENVKSQAKPESQTADYAEYLREIESLERLVNLNDQSLFELLILENSRPEQTDDEQLLSLVANIRSHYLTTIS